MPGTDIADVADAAIEYLTESGLELTPGVEDATKPARGAFIGISAGFAIWLLMVISAIPIFWR